MTLLEKQIKFLEVAFSFTNSFSHFMQFFNIRTQPSSIYHSLLCLLLIVGQHTWPVDEGPASADVYIEPSLCREH